MSNQSATLAIALAVAARLAARPTWRARTDHELARWSWEVESRARSRADRRAAGALLLLLAPAGGARLNRSLSLSLRLRLTRPALTARRRALLARRPTRGWPPPPARPPWRLAAWPQVSISGVLERLSGVDGDGRSDAGGVSA